MKYGKIKNTDIANGPGVRVSLFVSGCRNHCHGCFNPETWDFHYGKNLTTDVMDRIVKSLTPWWISGLTILGGEPFEPENQPAVLRLIRKVKRLLPLKTIWCYSGYTFEDLAGWSGNQSPQRIKETDSILNQIDVLVDGPFIEEEKDISLLFRGSSNQRLIDVPKTLASGKIVLWTNQERDG